MPSDATKTPKKKNAKTETITLRWHESQDRALNELVELVEAQHGFPRRYGSRGGDVDRSAVMREAFERGRMLLALEAAYPELDELWNELALRLVIANERLQQEYPIRGVLGPDPDVHAWVRDAFTPAAQPGYRVLSDEQIARIKDGP